MKRACMESPYERTREELRGRHMGMCRKRKGEKMRLLVDAKRKDPQRRFGTDWMPSPTLPFNSVWKGPGKEEEPTKKRQMHTKDNPTPYMVDRTIIVLLAEAMGDACDAVCVRRFRVRVGPKP